MYITTVVIEEIMSSMRNGVGDGGAGGRRSSGNDANTVCSGIEFQINL